MLIKLWVIVLLDWVVVSNVFIPEVFGNLITLEADKVSVSRLVKKSPWYSSI